MAEGGGNARATRVGNERVDVSPMKGRRRAVWLVRSMARSVPLTRIHSPGSEGSIVKDKSLKPQSEG